MSWFNVIKTLQSKTGYAQLDFDNIVEEEETNCLKRLKEWNAKVHKYTVDGQTKRLKNNYSNSSRYFFYKDGEVISTSEVFDEIPDMPEEVACALIEFIQGIKDYKYKKEEGGPYEEYEFSFSEFDFTADKNKSYILLYVGVGKPQRKMYRIYFANTTKEKEKFKRWLSSVV